MIDLKGFLGSIEKKVYAATGASTAAGVVVAALNDVEAHHALLGALPEAAQTAILAVVPGLLAFLTAFNAPHTARPAAPVALVAEKPAPDSTGKD